MAKNLKLKIKQTELAKAGLDKLKAKLSGEKVEEKKPKAKTPPPPATEEEKKKEGPRIRAKSRSSFAPQEASIEPEKEEVKEIEEEIVDTPVIQEEQVEEKLGPTGKHVKDLLTKKEPEPEAVAPKVEPEKKIEPAKEKETTAQVAEKEDKDRKGKKVREFKDLKPKKMRPFDARDRQGLTEDEDGRWRKKRPVKQVKTAEEQIVRPTELSIRLPISIKDLAAAMKLKSGELIQQLFLQGMTYTVNDILEDETTVQYLGNEFGCHITIDTSEEERIQITAHSIREEIAGSDPHNLELRPPVVTFMGHVDHGKTSLIDAIRKSNRVAGEAGAITQHMGAFKCTTPVGDITILDTPGHEAFSAMRARGAEVTDIVVLVVAGDEGIREQTVEAIQHAKAAKVTIVVAINKADKPNFNPENVYRQLAEVELLPESWGGQTITVNTSAVSGAGITELLEMLALQAEVLELRANPKMRARGTVLESEMHKGLGMVARVLIQNGTLFLGDALVFERHWGRVKTMHDEHGKRLTEAGPSTPVEITGLSGIPAAGDPFIVVKSEKEARDIVEARQTESQQQALKQVKASSLEKYLQKTASGRKVLHLILRGDVQGSVEALKSSIQKIQSEKVDVEVIFSGVGEVSESDIQLAAASNAVIVGFHTSIEKHANELIKELGIKVILFDVIYHAIDAIKGVMQGLLDKIEEQRDTGSAEVQAVFKSSQLGNIAGCIVSEGIISRNHRIRVLREGKEVWKGEIASLKRVKEDVKEVKKGIECGILLNGFNDVRVGDILQAYETVYLTQEI